MPRQILGRAAHGDIGGGVEQRLPQKILELDLAHAEAGAVGIGCDRIAAHRFGADAEREIDTAMADRIGRLHDGFDARAADALHEMRRHLDRHAGVEPDVARQHVGVEARLRHVAGDHGADIAGRRTGTREHLARRLDAQVDRRDLRQIAVVIDERRAHAVKQPHVLP